jgi:hypothetical protein
MRMMYVAAVEVATRHQVDVDAAMRTLDDYRPALGTSSRGWVEVQVVLSATNLAHACAKATAIARAATGADALACQVMTEREYEQRNGVANRLGRHAASQEKPWVLPQQATESRDYPRAQPGRHSA